MKRCVERAHRDAGELACLRECDVVLESSREPLRLLVAAGVVAALVALAALLAFLAGAASAPCLRLAEPFAADSPPGDGRSGERPSRRVVRVVCVTEPANGHLPGRRLRPPP